MIRLHILAALGITTAFSSSWARGGIIFDHPPHPYGGGASDTLFTGPFGQQAWQRVADDFVLPASATISSLIAFGFYNEDNPPPTETMRVRFMGARPTDGLPDEASVLLETTFLNPTRVATGNIVLTGIGPHEYRYEMSFSTPIPLQGGEKYWLEFVQVGDLSTHFRWEDSIADGNGLAFINSVTNTWRSSLPGGFGDCAYQLIGVPEPAAISILAFVFVVNLAKRGRKAGARVKP